jgi:hypothetical protein
MLFSCHHSLNHSGECVIFLNIIFAPVVQLHQDSGTPRFDLFLSLMFFIQPTVFAIVRRNPSRNTREPDHLCGGGRRQGRAGCWQHGALKHLTGSPK